MLEAEKCALFDCLAGCFEFDVEFGFWRVGREIFLRFLVFDVRFLRFALENSAQFQKSTLEVFSGRDENGCGDKEVEIKMLHREDKLKYY